MVIQGWFQGKAVFRRLATLAAKWRGIVLCQLDANAMLERVNLVVFKLPDRKRS